MGYNKEALTQNIEKCKVNIKTFEEAIANERATIKSYYDMMEKMDEQARVQKEAMKTVEVVRE